MQAVTLELTHHPRHRAAVLGDLNCEPHILPAFADARRSGRLFDVQPIDLLVGSAAGPRS